MDHFVKYQFSRVAKLCLQSDTWCTDHRHYSTDGIMEMVMMMTMMTMMVMMLMALKITKIRGVARRREWKERIGAAQLEVTSFVTFGGLAE